MDFDYSVFFPLSLIFVAYSRQRKAKSMGEINKTCTWAGPAAPCLLPASNKELAGNSTKSDRVSCLQERKVVHNKPVGSLLINSIQA